MILPFPDATATAITETDSVDIAAGGRETVEFTPERSGTRFVVGTVAISAYDDVEYTVKMDGNAQYGPAQTPPTDPDDMSVVWVPALKMNDQLSVVINDQRSTGSDRTFDVQPVGYEEPTDD